MLAPETIRANAYRTLRLSAAASISEVHNAAASIRRVATLGLLNPIEADLPELGAIPREDADLRAAVGRLTNPAQRLIERVFWFYRLPQGASGATPDPAGHDRALLGLIGSYRQEADQQGIVGVMNALRDWHHVVSRDDYWSVVLSNEGQGGFEPAASLS